MAAGTQTATVMDFSGSSARVVLIYCRAHQELCCNPGFSLFVRPEFPQMAYGLRPHSSTGPGLGIGRTLPVRRVKQRVHQTTQCSARFTTTPSWLIGSLPSSLLTYTFAVLLQDSVTTVGSSAWANERKITVSSAYRTISVRGSGGPGRQMQSRSRLAWRATSNLKRLSCFGSFDFGSDANHLPPSAYKAHRR